MFKLGSHIYVVAFIFRPTELLCWSLLINIWYTFAMCGIEYSTNKLSVRLNEVEATGWLKCDTLGVYYVQVQLISRLQRFKKTCNICNSASVVCSQWNRLLVRCLCQQRRHYSWKQSGWWMWTVNYCSVIHTLYVDQRPIQ